jgi:hypothetical protein
MLRALAVLPFVLLSGAAARADVIDLDRPRPVCPPLACPPGSPPVGGGHSGCPSLCRAPTPCDEATPCEAGSRCTAAAESLCLERVSFGNYAASVRRDACAAAACPDDQTCWTGRYCVPDPSAAPSPTDPPPPASTPPAPTPPAPAPAEPRAGGCAVGGRSAHPALALVATLALVGFRRAGRRRRAQAC